MNLLNFQFQCNLVRRCGVCHVLTVQPFVSFVEQQHKIAAWNLPVIQESKQTDRTAKNVVSFQNKNFLFLWIFSLKRGQNDGLNVVKYVFEPSRKQGVRTFHKNHLQLYYPYLIFAGYVLVRGGQGDLVQIINTPNLSLTYP